jgi:Ser/Thr protein kinase RdoA (MazF antagonist)
VNHDVPQTDEPAAGSDLRSLEAVARAALPRFGFPEGSTLALLHHRENAVFRVDDASDGRAWALRVHRAGYRTTREIRSELLWMDALREAGVQTPRARRGIDADPVQTVAAAGLSLPRDVDVLSWIEGIPLDAGAGAEAYRLLGSICARIQQQARSWTPPAGFARPTWDAASLVGRHAHWGDYAELAMLLPEQLALLHRAAAVVFRRLRAFGQAPDRFGLTHGDLMPDNVLVHQGVPTIIDFDDSGYGWYLYDLATLLAVKLADADYEAARDAWLEGYRTQVLLPDAHLEELDTLVMARGLLLLGWMHTRRETPTARLLAGAVIALACAQAEKLLATEKG